MVAERVDLLAQRNSLATLAERLPGYSEKLRQAGFSACHVNEDWVASQCNADDLVQHRRYLIEYAAEVLAADEPSAIVPRDSYVCRSSWLQQRKNERIKEHGPADELCRRPGSKHLIELSPGWREFMRVRESRASVDRKQVATQVATFVQRRAREVVAHREAIDRCMAALPLVRDESSLQVFFAAHLAKSLMGFGASAVSPLCWNQVLRRAEKIRAVSFDAGHVLNLVLIPSVYGSSLIAGGRFAGTIGVGFRLMTPAALDASNFEFDRDIVLHLHVLLPGRFNDYGRFDNPEELCLNIEAWLAALHILLPDVLQVLRSSAN